MISNIEKALLFYQVREAGKKLDRTGRLSSYISTFIKCSEMNRDGGS